MTHASFTHSLLVMWLLLRREFIVLAHSWKIVAGSTIVFSLMMALSAGYFMPQMGMPIGLAVPLFLGSFLATCLSLGYTGAIEVGYDLKSPRLAFFYYGLPVSLSVVLLGLMCSSMIRMLIISVPVLCMGLLGINQWHLFSVSWSALIVIMLLCAQFNALLFLSLAYGCSLTALMGNIWPRFLSPLFAFGCVFYTWKPVAQKAWLFSRIMLCSPLTYCCEGLRSALLGGDAYLSSTVCIIVLMILNVALWFVLRRLVIRAVNPVVVRRLV